MVRNLNGSAPKGEVKRKFSVQCDTFQRNPGLGTSHLESVLEDLPWQGVIGESSN